MLWLLRLPIFAMGYTFLAIGAIGFLFIVPCGFICCALDDWLDQIDRRRA